MSGTFDPSASPAMGGYSLVKSDANTLKTFVVNCDMEDPKKDSPSSRYVTANVRVKAADREEALEKGVAYYKKKGYVMVRARDARADSIDERYDAIIAQCDGVVAACDASFKSGDYVMDRDTQKMGVVVEVEGNKVTVDWKDGRRTTVKASSLKG